MKGSPFETGPGATRVVIGDLNNDSINDIVVSNYKSNFVSVYYMNKNGVQSTSQLPIGKGSDGDAIYDLDGDGKKTSLQQVQTKIAFQYFLANDEDKH